MRGGRASRPGCQIEQKLPEMSEVSLRSREEAHLPCTEGSRPEKGSSDADAGKQAEAG